MNRLLIVLFFIAIFFTASSSVNATLTVKRVKSKDSLIFIFNQPHYSLGDTAYYGVYVQTKFREEKNVLQIRLYKDNNEIFRQRIVIRENKGSGFFVFPVSMLSGEYSLISFVEVASKANSASLFRGNLSVSNDGSILMQREAMQLPPANSNFLCSPDREKYLTRSNVRLNIVNGNEPNGEETDFLITVYKADLFNKISPMTSLWPLTSYEDASFLSMLSDRPYYFKGRLIDKMTGNLVEESARVTFYLSENNLAYELYTKKDGSFLFPLFHDFVSDAIFYTIYQKDGGGSKTLGVVTDEFKYMDDNLVKETLTSEEGLSYTNYSQQVKRIDESYNFFSKKRDDLKNTEKKPIPADHEIFLEKYEPFFSMAEIVMNIVPMVKYKNEVEGIRIFLQSSAGYGEDNPLFLVDGVMTADIRYVLQMNPEDIKRIGVIRTARALNRFGDLGRNGILVIDTNLKNKMPEYDKNTIHIVGIEHKNQTLNKNPIPTLAGDQRKPFLRSFLYWNPSVKIKNGDKVSIEFYTADDVGDYVIELTSLNQDGIFSLQKKIKVEK